MTVNDAIGQAAALMSAGRLAEADAMARAIRRVAPDLAPVLNLSGMIARRSGDNRSAADWFSRSLAQVGNQPDTLNNLGNSLIAIGERDRAIAAYRDALNLAPGHVDAALNLALALLAGDDPAAASAAIGPALHAHPGDPRLLATSGRCRAATGDHQGAATLFRQSLDRRPDHVPTLHSLAAALRASGRAREAVAVLDRCLALAPQQAECRILIGHCHQDMGEIDSAIAAYRRAIDHAPTNRDAHDSLARLLWQQGSEAHLDAYRAALSAHPGDVGLATDLGRRLLLAGDAAGAVAAMSSVAASSRDIDLRHWHARALWSAGQGDAAIAAFRTILADDPDHAATARELARSLIVLDRPAEAQPVLSAILARDPADQQALALTAVASRLTGDDTAAERLMDRRLIHVTRIDPPGGDRTAFNAALDAALTPLHRSRRHPLEQTLRGGTQTSDDLFTLAVPEVAAVRERIRTAVADYIAALPDDPDHPFTRRSTGAFRFTGSWSVRLRDQGYHENHLHPEGWISAVYYVAVPDAVDENRQGWLTFGRTALRLGDRERELAAVRPEPGMLVLFPSYFYHGTLPFSDSAHRTTIAFDVAPM
jgi:tetratricopeptide (TPR) repeat protein